jgi:hypothetical protein
LIRYIQIFQRPFHLQAVAGYRVAIDTDGHSKVFLRLEWLRADPRVGGDSK